MTTSNTKVKYNTIHPFDTVYSLVFIYLMLDLFAKTVVISIKDYLKSGSFEILSYSTFITLFFIFQLTRMYYHLKNFENIISKEENNHFLEILPLNIQSLEKSIRLILAIVLILFIKVQDSYPYVLGFCFFVLFLWDVIVTNGLSSKWNTTFNNNTTKESLETGKSFFYWSEDLFDENFKPFCNYFINFKFYERLFGLFASGSALWYFYTKENSSSIPVFFLIIFTFLFIICKLLGNWISKTGTPQRFIYEQIKNIFEPFYMPLFNLINNITNNSNE